MTHRQGKFFKINQHGQPIDACASFKYKNYVISMSTHVDHWSDFCVIVFDKFPSTARVWEGYRVDHAIAWVDAQ